MNDFNWALKQLENGKKVKRTDWGYSSKAFITLEKMNRYSHFYITNKHNGNPMLEGYSMDYQDLISTKWTFV